MVLTGNKDVDLYILYKLDDTDLFNLCSLQYDNNDIYELCNNEHFWRERYLSKWGYEAGNLKPDMDSWKTHYINTIRYNKTFDTPEFNMPWLFFNYIYWSYKGIEHSFYVKDNYFSRRIKLEEAPHNILIPFYTLNIYKYLNSTHRNTYINFENKLTPYMYLTIVSENIKKDMYTEPNARWTKFIHGFIAGGYPMLLSQYIE